MRRSGFASARSRRPKSRSRSWARSRAAAADAGGEAMKFGAVPPREAEGAIAVHSIRKGGMVLKKGTLVGKARDRRARGGQGIRDRRRAARAGRRLGRRRGGRDRRRRRGRGRACRPRVHRPRQSVRRACRACWSSTRPAIDALNDVDRGDHVRDARRLRAGRRRQDDRDREDHSVRGRRRGARPRRLWPRAPQGRSCASRRSGCARSASSRPCCRASPRR